jgi:hypothetical protein
LRAQHYWKKGLGGEGCENEAPESVCHADSLAIWRYILTLPIDISQRNRLA